MRYTTPDIRQGTVANDMNMVAEPLPERCVYQKHIRTIQHNIGTLNQPVSQTFQWQYGATKLVFFDTY
jgi:hypothetical protein